MLNAIPMVISKESFEQIFTFAEDNSALAKNLYNAALFRIRQVFTGWNKTKRTELEQLVFDELKQNFYSNHFCVDHHCFVVAGSIS